MPHKFAPAPGYTVQGIHGESNGPRMLVATVATLCLAFIITILRMVVKVFIISSVSWEDFFAIAAMLLAIGRTIMLGVMTNNHQFGQHIWDIELANFGFVYTWAKGATLIYLGAIACAKVSILLLYIRLFRVNRPFRYTCYTLTALIIGYCTAMALANIFQCRPVHAGWNFFAPGHCASLQKITVATGAFNIITDVAIVVAPILVALRLQLRPAKMVGVLAVLATGFFVVAVSIIREVEVVRAPSLYDATWSDATRTLWLSVELHIGITCTCLPLLSPLGRKIPGRNYLKNQYHSMVSLIRGSRKKSRGSGSTSQNAQQPGSENKDYIELEESEVGIAQELNPYSEATIYSK